MARLQKKKSTQARIKKRVKTTGDDASKTASGSSTQAMAVRTRAEAPKKNVPYKGNRPVTPTKTAMAGGKLNWIQKSIQFLREVKVELKKVTWPSRKQTIGSTIVVLVLVVLISLFLGLVDWGLMGVVRGILQ